MVLNISEKNSVVAKLIADELRDEIISIDGLKGSASTVYSGSAYTFVMDCKDISRDIMKLYKETSFTGSKVLYCLFLSEDKEDIDAFAKKLSVEKGFVLFGYDRFDTNPQGALSERDFDRLRNSLDRIKSYRPFECGAFPYRSQFTA